MISYTGLNLKAPIAAKHQSFGFTKDKAVLYDDFNGFDLGIAKDINNDGRADLFHGYQVKGAFLAAGHHKDLPELKEIQDKFNVHNTNKVVKSILKRDDVHLLNMSSACLRSFKNITKEFAKTKISSENVHKHKEEIISNIKFSHLTGEKVFSNLKKLAKKVKVYVPAGNEGFNSLNIYSLADGVKTIGGLDLLGEPHNSSGENSLMSDNDWAPFVLEGVLIEGKDGKIGYDLAPVGHEGDKEVDILLSDIKLTGTNPPNKKIRLDGTTISAPYKAAKDYLARQNGEKEWNPHELYEINKFSKTA